MIEFDRITKNYRRGFWMQSVQALKQVSFQVNEGDLFGFIGPNGAGKSSSIRLLMGLMQPTTGTVRVWGKDPLQDSGTRLQMGYLPEQPWFYDRWTGWEVVEYAGRLSGLRGEALKSKTQDALARVRADKDWCRRPLRQYSKGMQQRIGLAQALVHQPKLLVLDEPMSGLDPVGRREFREALLSLHAEGTTIFYSSHVLPDVQAISTRVGMIVGGEIRQQGTVGELLSQGEDRYFFQTIPKMEHCPIAGVLASQDGGWMIPADLQHQVLEWIQNQGLVLQIWEPRRTNLEELLSKELAR
jgi:ABC-2 type transport system ATP-binding protein